MLKVKKWRNKKYLAWVKCLPSSVSRMQAEAYHHLIGHGQGCMGGKASDLLCMPLTFHEHMGDAGVHRMGHQKWEGIYGNQIPMIMDTINRAIEEGIVTQEFCVEEITNQISHAEEREYMLNAIG